MKLRALMILTVTVLTVGLSACEMKAPEPTDTKSTAEFALVKSLEAVGFAGSVAKCQVEVLFNSGIGSKLMEQITAKSDNKNLAEGARKLGLDKLSQDLSVCVNDQLKKIRK